MRSWPLLVLAAPAAVAVWSGWVGIGRMTGFGQVRPLPGIWDSLHIDSAVTLPVGVEAYAAYALRAWLSAAPVSAAARRFARWSAIGSLLLGMCGQVAYHLLTQAGAARAPWGITTVVSCLPVLVLGMGAALAHLLRAGGGPGADQRSGGPVLAGPADGDAGAGRVVRSGRDRLSVVRSGRDRPPMVRSGASARPDQTGAGDCGPVPVVVRSGHASAVRGDGGPGGAVPGQRGVAGRLDGRVRLAEARAAAGPLVASGERVSRRALRAAGLRGSNADLGALARILTAEHAAGSGT